MLEYHKEQTDSLKKDMFKMIYKSETYEETFTKLKNSNYFNEIRLIDIEKGVGVLLKPKPFFEIK
jgi:hypothetical protein